MRKYVVAVVMLLSILIIFKNWFLPGELSSGDWVYYPHNSLLSFSGLFAWDSRHVGLGSSSIPTLWLEIYLFLTSRIAQFVGWAIYERIFWFWPFLLLSISSSYLLFKSIFGKNTFAYLSSFLYTTNTYALLLAGGGQMGIALAYSFTPFVFLAFKRVIEKQLVFRFFLFALSFAVLIMLDLRVAYIVVIVLIIWGLFFLRVLFTRPMRTIWLFIASGVIVLLLHAFWLLPAALTHGSGIDQFGAIYTGEGAVKFFSFANFEHALGLLHPNWPENLFGLTHFMQPEFLLLPILSFASLLFVGKKNTNSKWIVLLNCIALLGIFLAKGATDPFGSVYVLLFQHFPGFIMFRDPTKWYLLIALSYSLLIPYTLKQTYILLKEKNRLFGSVLVILAIAVLAFLIRPAFFGQLSGTFQQHFVPSDYGKLETFLAADHTFSRVLYAPTLERYGGLTELHPSVDGYTFFAVASPSGILDVLSKKESEKKLQDAAIKYVVVPQDSQGEIFLKDRFYNKKLNDAFLTSIKKIPYLKEIPGFGHIHVFTIEGSKDHFWLNGGGTVSYLMNNPTDYTVKVQNAKKGEQLVFDENYDINWKAEGDNTFYKNSKFEHMFSSFALPKDGAYAIHVFYSPQKWLTRGYMLSGFSLISVVLALFYGIKSGKIGE